MPKPVIRLFVPPGHAFELQFPNHTLKMIAEDYGHVPSPGNPVLNDIVKSALDASFTRIRTLLGLAEDVSLSEIRYALDALITKVEHAKAAEGAPDIVDTRLRTILAQTFKLTNTSPVAIHDHAAYLQGIHDTWKAGTLPLAEAKPIAHDDEEEDADDTEYRMPTPAEVDAYVDGNDSLDGISTREAIHQAFAWWRDQQPDNNACSPMYFKQVGAIASLLGVPVWTESFDDDNPIPKQIAIAIRMLQADKEELMKALEQRLPSTPAVPLDLKALHEALNLSDAAPLLTFPQIVQKITVMSDTLTAVQTEHRLNSTRLAGELDSERRNHSFTHTQLSEARAERDKARVAVDDEKCKVKHLERELSTALEQLNISRRPEQDLVQDFHRLVGILINDKPTLTDKANRILRCTLILEEAFEFITACGLYVEGFNPSLKAIQPSDFIFNELQDANLVDMADAMGDILHVTLGAAVSFGINMKPVFMEIQRSNMSKLPGGSMREDGKWVKGPEYSPANIIGVLLDQGAEFKPIMDASIKDMARALGTDDAGMRALWPALDQPAASTLTGGGDPDVVISSEAMPGDERK